MMLTDTARWKGFEKGLAIALVLVLCVFGRLPASAQEKAVDSATSTPAAAPVPDDFSAIIDSLQQQINDKRDSITQMKQQMDAYQKQIEEKRSEAATLDNDLALLDNKTAKTELDIKASQLEIEATGLELQELDSQIQDKTLKIIRQRKMIGDFLRELNRSDKRTSIDLFLTEKTLSDFFNDVQYLQESQHDLKNALDTAKTLKADLEDRQAAANAKKAHLVDIQKDLVTQKDQLDEEKTAKAALAEEVRVSETRYSYELGQLKREQENANNDITQIESKLRKTLNSQRLEQLSGGPGGWAWPIDPSRGITTYFHDPDYPFRHIFEHPGIDIRTAHGSPVRATKGGYIARAKDGGMGYSYVMIVHDGGMASVYGHLSRIVAQQDTYIEKGDLLGYSGGTPGTPGAGPLTTGPHLHFEIRLNGIPVDPLGYLKL